MSKLRASAWVVCTVMMIVGGGLGCLTDADRNTSQRPWSNLKTGAPEGTGGSGSSGMGPNEPGPDLGMSGQGDFGQKGAASVPHPDEGKPHGGAAVPSR